MKYLAGIFQTFYVQLVCITGGVIENKKIHLIFTLNTNPNVMVHFDNCHFVILHNGPVFITTQNNEDSIEQRTIGWNFAVSLVYKLKA